MPDDPRKAKGPSPGRAPRGRNRRAISLALQGGGSHGAFTWGVLDRLLEDGRFDIEGISGTSAGAVNGAVLAYGLATGGADGARALLEQLWTRVADRAQYGPFQPTPWDRMTGNPNLDASPIYAAFDLMTRMVSPYQFNPFDWNPLRDLLDDLIGFDTLRALAKPRLYVSATNVTRGQLKIFAGEELSIEALMASTCLPFLFRAVEIGGKAYWDGGYMGNPTLYPLIHACDARDVVVVQINPIRRPDVPMMPTDIIDRMNEISFNSTFLREARAMGLINRLLEERELDEKSCGLRPVYLHMIGDEAAMDELTASSKLNADWSFLERLFRIGRARADQWLEDCASDLGKRSTFDAGEMFV
ncbi:MAG: patatin-like phospholipase family protein [Alphaproteobacteria bacterium]|jgi:NTE family protein|nr:patatin-like phospholipase family protein [Alphaproteobacteria bacterium]